MTISKEKIKEILNEHPSIFVDDASEALVLAADFLTAESDAIEQEEPYATKTIEAYRNAAYVLFDMSLEIPSEDF